MFWGGNKNEEREVGRISFSSYYPHIMTELPLPLSKQSEVKKCIKRTREKGI